MDTKKPKMIDERNFQSTKQRVKSFLTKRGLSDREADEIMDIAIPEIESLNANYNITWNSNANGYDEAVYNMLWWLLRPIALKWIVFNIPNAWFKDAFTNKA